MPPSLSERRLPAGRVAGILPAGFTNTQHITPNRIPTRPTFRPTLL